MLSTQELNILCIGQQTAGKSTFLQSYTHSPHTQQHYKIFTRRQASLKKLPIIYFHEIEQKMGVDVYLNRQYDGILFFVKIDDFHKTRKNVIESLSLYSQVSGYNIYKIPIKIMVISCKRGQKYDDIAYGEKRKLQEEVSSLLDQQQIIYVESDQQDYQHKLAVFYRQLISNEAMGIKETIYSNWHTRGILNFIGFDQLKLHLGKLYQEIKFTCTQKTKSFNLISHKKL